MDLNATKNVVSITTTNSIHEIAGTFNIDLIYRRDKAGNPVYYEMIQPLDIVDIWLSKRTSTMVGIIDTVSKPTTMSDRGPQRRVRITGRSLGAIWLFDLIKFFKGAINLPPKLQQRNLQLQQGAIKLEFYGESPIEAVTTLYEKLPALEIKLKEAVLKDFIDVGTELFGRKGETIYNMGLSGYSGTMFQYFRKYVAAPFNELWTDSKDGKLYLRMRPTPFGMFGDEEIIERKSKATGAIGWRHIRNWIDRESYHTVTPDMVREENLRRSHARAYSIFVVLPGDPFVGNENPYTTFPPLIEPDLYAEVGSRDYAMRLDYLPVENRDLVPGSGGTIEKFKFYRNKLYLWNKDNHRLEEGAMTIRGDADIRVGDKVKRSDTDMTYYVESVSNQWQFGIPMTTSLDLTRGATDKYKQTLCDQGLEFLKTVP